nr:site-specific DNA-methyltransferase [Candidatus Freyrarchaeum guaymaensis]
MATWHKIIFGDCRNMLHDLKKESVQLMITSPPYFNAPFDYPGLFSSYEEYLDLISTVGSALIDVLAEGRIACFVVQDVRIKGELYPITSDITKIMREVGFRYRDKIIWKKTEGYIRISRRSGVMLQHPYPMYYYPDNIFEEILIFQKGKFDYKLFKKTNPDTLERSKIDVKKYQTEKWYLSVWEITNVLPLEGRLEQGIAAFPEEIPRRIITLFTLKGEVVLDPFLGSGTTIKVARQLERNSIGYEIDIELKDVILEKIGYYNARLIENDQIIIQVKEKEVKKLRTYLSEKVKNQRSASKKNRS